MLIVRNRPATILLAAAAAAACVGPGAVAQPGTVQAQQKISVLEGGFGGVLDNNDRFGRSIVNVGDLDGDGVVDLAVGAYRDDDGGPDRGAIWFLFLNADGTVKGEQKISDSEGGFGGNLEDGDRFGVSITPIGDLDDDGVGDIAVGAYWDSEAGQWRGAVWILFLMEDRTVKAAQKINDRHGGFTGVLENSDKFGASVAGLGDLDGDGNEDLAVAAILDDGGGFNRGAIWMLFLNANGTVKSHQKINDVVGGFDGLADSDQFGTRSLAIPDLDGDGIVDLVASSPLGADGGEGRGVVWVLFLKTDGTVRDYQRISDTNGGFGGELEDFDRFGGGLAWLGDLDGDGVGDLAVGAHGDDDGGSGRGSVWILFMDTDGTVKSERKISELTGGFAGPLADQDWFGSAATGLGDLDGDGVTDLCVGAQLDNDGGPDRGAVWCLFLDGVRSCPADLDGSGDVGLADLLVVLAAWGPYEPCPPHVPADLDADCEVGFEDLLTLLGAWGGCG